MDQVGDHRDPRAPRAGAWLSLALALAIVYALGGSAAQRWLRAIVVPATGAPKAEHCQVLSETLNLRGGPGTGFALAGVLSAGQDFEAQARSAEGAWVFGVGESAEGWAATAALSCAEDPAGLPAARTDEQAGAVSLRYWAEDPTLDEGRCTTLRWSVSNVAATWLGQEPVPAIGSREICPEQDTRIGLRWRRHDGSMGEQQLDLVLRRAGQQPLPGPAPLPEGSHVAYQVAAGTRGNQPHEGPLGMDFDVQAPVRITHLGVFDSGQDGLRSEIRCAIYDRLGRERLVELRFAAEAGELVEGSRFLALPTPLDLPAGFRGSVVAEGYGPLEPNGNGIGGPVDWLTDDGDGRLRFVGSSRWNWPHGRGSYPTLIDSGPANRYAAGSFRFEAASAP